MDRIDYNEFPDEYTPQKLAGLTYIARLLDDLKKAKQEQERAEALERGRLLLQEQIQREMDKHLPFTGGMTFTSNSSGIVQSTKNLDFRSTFGKPPEDEPPEGSMVPA